MILRLTFVALLAAACVPVPRAIDPETGKPRPSMLNFEYCEKIALETRKSGKTSNQVCPGFMPNGYPVELFG